MFLHSGEGTFYETLLPDELQAQELHQSWLKDATIGRRLEWLDASPPEETNPDQLRKRAL